MKRRRLLVLSGTLAGSLFAGCLDGGDPSGSNAGTETTAATTATTETATSSTTPTSTRRETTERETDQPTTEASRSPTAAPTGTTNADEPTATDGSAIVDRRLTVADRTCGNPTDEGTIEFANGRVALTGTITGSDGCATALIEDLTYDRGADRLRVLVATEKESNGGAICTQCLTEIDYEASVALESGLPGTVVLVHRSGTGETRVASASS